MITSTKSQAEIPSITTLMEIVAPLTLLLPDMNVQGLGSCFVIGAMGGMAIAVTAAHCLDQAEKLDIPNRVQSAPSALFTVEKNEKTWNRVELQASLRHRNLPPFMSLPLEVHQAYWNRETDIAFLLLSPSEEYSSAVSIDRQIGLLLDHPSVGEDALVVGFFETDVSATHHRKSDGRAAFQRIAGRVQAVQAKVVGLHEDGIRDLRWPCIKVSSPFYSGMSGGCILVKRGSEWLATAVVSRDLSESNNASGAEAYAALIAPAINTAFPEKQYRRIGESDSIPIRSIYDLINVGVIRVWKATDIDTGVPKSDYKCATPT